MCMFFSSLANATTIGASICVTFPPTVDLFFQLRVWFRKPSVTFFAHSGWPCLWWSWAEKDHVWRPSMYGILPTLHDVMVNVGKLGRTWMVGGWFKYSIFLVLIVRQELWIFIRKIECLMNPYKKHLQNGDYSLQEEKQINQSMPNQSITYNWSWMTSWSNDDLMLEPRNHFLTKGITLGF